MSDFWLYQGDCVEVLRQWPDNSVDAVVCDPPYEIGFMSKGWDKAGVAFAPATWAEMLRVLKPGGHLLAFGGSRTYHRIACAIEDAGFEVRDSLMWLYGSGFPKSKNVALSIDKGEGHPNRGRAIPTASTHLPGGKYAEEKLTSNPVEAYTAKSPEAKAWEGWGTALKPAHEPIVLARKPLDGTVAANVQKWGTGALNIDACRIGSELVTTHSRGTNGAFPKRPTERSAEESGRKKDQAEDLDTSTSRTGRWPANVMLDEEAAAMLDAQTGTLSVTGVRRAARSDGKGAGDFLGAVTRGREYPADSGGASRFFYVAKTSRRERDHGLDAFPARSAGEATDREDGSAGLSSPRAGAGRTGGAKNIHPTVKPVALMRQLIRLVTPPGGIVLDPFVGSGSTGMAARLEGARFVGIDLSAEYLTIAHARISAALTLK